MFDVTELSDVELQERLIELRKNRKTGFTKKVKSTIRKSSEPLMPGLEALDEETALKILEALASTLDNPVE